MSSEKVWSGVNAASDQLIVLLRQRVALLERACSKQQDEILQTLGKALGYPWYRDDQKDFPGATEEHGVCTGDHVAETIAVSAAERIKTLEGERAELFRFAIRIRDSYDCECDDGCRCRACDAEKLIAKLEGPQES